MPRTARIVIPGVAHHVVQRGNRRQPVFFGPHHYKLYLRLLTEHCLLYELKVMTYCLMPNHVHMILIPSDSQSLAKCMKDTHQKFTTMVNKELQWTGCLWQGRFFSRPMDDVYTLYAARYIERNPIEAGLTQKSQTYPWSGAFVQQPPILHPILDQTILNESFDSWRTFVNHGPSKRFYDEQVRITKNQRPLGNVWHLGTGT